MKLVRCYSNGKETANGAGLDTTSAWFELRNSEGKTLWTGTKMEVSNFPKPVGIAMMFHGVMAKVGDGVSGLTKTGTKEEIAGELEGRIKRLTEGTLSPPRTVGGGGSPKLTLILARAIVNVAKAAGKTVSPEKAKAVVESWDMKTRNANLKGCAELRKEYEALRAASEPAPTATISVADLLK